MKQTTVTEKRFYEWHEDDVSVTLRHKGGSYGGERNARHLIYTDTVGAICARDYKGIGNQYVNEGKLVIEVLRDDSWPCDSQNNEGGCSFTLSSRDYKGVMIVVVSECDRSADGKQPSRELLRTGCVQRDVDNGE